MTRYIAVVHKDPDSAFGVTFPDLPGCFSAADGEGDLIDNAREAVALWAEDDALPPPSGIEAIRARPTVAEALREGAFLLAVPVARERAAA